MFSWSRIFFLVHGACGESWKDCVRDPLVTVQIDMRTPCGRMEFLERLGQRAVDTFSLHSGHGNRNGMTAEV